MIEPGIDKRVKVSQIIQGQLPSYVAIENPKSIDFLKQYYLSQDSQGLPADIIDNLDQYLKFDSLTPEVVSGTTTLTADVSDDDSIFNVESTKGYPNTNGLFKVGDEIIYYTGSTSNSFTGCVRGFSGITDYSSGEVVFNKTSAESHSSGDTVSNLNVLFLREFFKSLKVLFAPGFEDESFNSDLNVNNFVKNLRSFYQSKGTNESFNILMSCLFGENATVRNNSESLFSSSESEFRRRLFLVAEKVSGGDPLLLSGQTLSQDNNSNSLVINGASAPISEVEYTNRDGKDYYNIYLFQKYLDPSPGFEGEFSITPSTRCIGEVSIGDNVISVDTTIGFPKSGLLVSGNNVITYTDKTINQFLNCSGIERTILSGDDVRTNDVIYGYTRGDNEKVELRLTGTISNFEPIAGERIANTNLGDDFRTKSIGRKIINPDENKTVIENTFNSWKYNTASRIQISSFAGSVFVLGIDIDKAYLRNGDVVEVVQRGTNIVPVSEATVSITGDNEVVLSGTGISDLNTGISYDIRRKLKKASSSGIELQYGNDKITSNILNTYITKDSSEIFVASNSLPDYEISLDTIKRTIPVASVDSGSIQDLNSYGTYNILSFSDTVPFITGDEIVYIAGTAETPISGLEFGRNYFVEVLSPANKIRLYVARSFIQVSQNIKINEPIDEDTGSHSFIAASQYNKKIRGQKLLKKFSLERSFDTGSEINTIPGPTGMLINGVEVVNYKVEDKIYYGPLEEITLFNGGGGYDVVNPPKLNITGSSSTTGTNAITNLAVTGVLKDVLIDPQDFNINKINSISIVGGNGTGAEVEPIVIDYFRQVGFNGKYTESGGGVSIYEDTIETINNHNFKDGEPIVYSSNGNPSIPITGFGQTTLTGNFLETGGVYYAEVIDSLTFRLYETVSDFNGGINTVGFSTGSTSGGKHIFTLQESTKKLTGVNVLNPGSGYSNREVAIKTTGVSTVTNSLEFTSHGYETGELVTYSTTGDNIVGLNTDNQYFIIKINNNNFRLSDAGIGGTDTSDFNRRLVQKFSGIGTGLHVFNYQPIEVEINASIANTVGVITGTPIVTGEIVDVLLYEKGTDYGSKILNFEKRPGINVLNGNDVEFQPLIIDGQIIDILVTRFGENYFSPPDIIITSESGFGAVGRAVINDVGNVIDAIVLNSGSKYDAGDTFITGVSRGSNATFNSKVRGLSLNNRSRFPEYNGETVFDKGENELQYGVIGYNQNLKNSFEDTNENAHSPLIGYAYDGNPIYGSYGYTDANNSTSLIKEIKSGYELDVSQVVNRPSGFPAGIFVEDYSFKGTGDLDDHNGRFSKTPEYPNGVYAYYATIENDPGTGDIISSFPYFVGNTYRSTLVRENIAGSEVEINQDFDFNNNGLIRNTFPYNVSELFANYDFFTQPYQTELQRVIVKSKFNGGIDNIGIVSFGSDYKVGDNIVFDDEGTGGGASAEVLELIGKDVESITKEVLSYENFTFERLNGNQVVGYISTYHDLEATNIINISGLSTFVAGLGGNKTIGVPADDFKMLTNMPAEAVGGMATDIPVAPIPEFLRPNTDILIGDETLTILNVFDSKNVFDNFRGVVRAVRGISGSGHTVGTAITSKANRIIFNYSGENLNSKADTVYYFNPTEVIGFGTEVGVSTVRDYELLGVTTTRDIPTQSIYIQDHIFKNNQKVDFVKTSSGNPVSVSTVSAGSTFNLPDSGDIQTVYITNKSKNNIGIKTTLDSDELFFSNCDSESYEYYITSINNKITGNIDRLTARVSTASSHGLQVGDSVNFTLKSDLSVGIGTSTSVKVLFEDFIQNITVDPIGFTSTSVGLTSSRILVNSHGLVTGDLIFYDADELPAGIETGKYFVFSGDPDSFSLAETKSDITGDTLNLIEFTSVGGTSHTISKVNPQIPVIKNNDLVFDVSDSSLSGYNFKIYYDQEYRNRIVGTGQSTVFEVETDGAIGIGTTTATITVKFNEYLPNQLYYNVEELSTDTLIEPDSSVDNYSRILFSDSSYTNKSASVVGVASTSFLVNLREEPKKDSYTLSECDVISYTTRSTTTSGGIAKSRIISKGSDYNITPGISTITTESGSNAELFAISKEIGILGATEVQKSGFDFSVDKTLKPIADIPTYYELKRNKTLDTVKPSFGGKNYLSVPNLTLVESTTGKQIDNASLICSIDSGSINKVDIVSPGFGLAGVAHTVYALTGDNGLSIITADSVNTGIVTFTVVTPILGFSTNPLRAGDEVFVDGIDEYSSDGLGFNSKDYKFNFFKVTSFNGGIVPSTVTIDLSGISTNPGIAVTTVNFGTIIKRENYPIFNVTLKSATFIDNESLIVVKGNNNVKTNLTVVYSDDLRLRTFGDYKLVIGDVIIGEVSGTRATVETIDRYDGLYEVNFGSTIRYGWTDNRGFLNDDSQVVPDNNYYQKMAYSIKSPIEFDELIDPVNRLAHISGTKNFADTQIQTVAVAATNFVDAGASTLVIDIFADADVTTINNFDFAVDTDIINSPSAITNSIKFGNKKLTNYIECKTNRVLTIDDISSEFIDFENTVGNFKDIISYSAGTGVSRFIIIVRDVVDRTSYEVHEIVVLVDGEPNTFILQKNRIKANPQVPVIDPEAEITSLGEIDSLYDDVSATVKIRFTPSNPLKTYDIKAFRQVFDSRTSGIGSVTIGDTVIFGSTNTVGVGTTTSIVDLGIGDFNSAFAYVEITNQINSERDYAEVTILHDGVNAYIGEFGFNTSDRLLSFNPIGTFGATLVSDVLNLNYTNNSSNSTLVKASIVGFKTTNVGLRSEFFKLETQEGGSERTARLESNVIEEVAAGYGITVVGISTLNDRLAKSVIRVSSGNTQSLSQVMFTQDFGSIETFVVEYPQLGINTAIGFGTFSSEYSGQFANLVFIPDSKFTGDTIRIEEFSEIVYIDQDTNITSIPDFGFGTVIENVFQSRYTPNAKLDFELEHEGFQIYARRFNPQNSTVFDQTTGNIFIESHFLQDGQDIVYESGSTISGITSEAIGIGTTIAGGTEVTGDIFTNSKVVSSASTDQGLNIDDEFFGPGIGDGATIVSVGSTFRFFVGNSDGTNVITSIANTSVLAIGDTIVEELTQTGFGTITSIGINSIVVDNNVPVGVGSTYYSERLGIGISLSVVSTANTTSQVCFSGVTTDILPSNLFAIRIDNNNIKLATKKDFALRGVGIEPTSTGSGNDHLIDTTKKLEKSLIILDGVVQAPISRTLVEYDIQVDAGIGRTFLPLTGISTLVPDYILKVDDELMNIQNVGLGTSSSGPISGVGTFNLVNVERGFVGTEEVTHTDGTRAIVHRGAYNIVESKVHFVDAPKGAGGDFILDDRGLEFLRSDFSGRVYLKQDYTTNEIYDDISPSFTGIAKTFGLTVGGNYPVGLDTGSGSGVLFINGIHQGQTTDNNPSNVYELNPSDTTVDVEFSGTKLISGDPYLSELDAIKNQLPVGGRIVSIASSGGTGIAPLVGAKVIAEVGTGGSITNILGADTVGTYTTITDFVYDGVSGIATVTTAVAHGLVSSDFVSLRDIEFDCTSGYDSLVGVSTLDYDNVSGIMTVTTKTDHFLNKDMEVKFRDLKFECAKGFDNLLGVSTASYDHLSGIITVTTSSAHDLNRNMKVKFHDLKFECTKEFLPTVGIYTADYDNVSGIITVSTIGDHKLNRNMKVKFYDLEMECQKGFDTQLGISSTEYDHVSGILTVTTSTNHLLNKGMSLRLADLEFACTEEHAGVTTTIFPDGTNGRIFNTVESALSATQFTTQVGITTIPHIPIGGGTVETGITTTKFPSKAGIQYGITGFDYTESTGVGTITVNRNHNITIGETVDIRNIEFTCAVEHAGVTTTTFPDGTQGFEYEVLSVPSATELKVNVGISTIAHTYDSGGFVSGVKYLEGYTVTNVGSGTEFTAQIDTVGFAHTYVSGGLVQSGVTTNVFPSSEGKQFAIVNFEYTENSGSSIITLSGNHEISVGTDVKLEDIEFICSSEHAGVTTTIFPDGTQGDTFKVTGVGASTININVGISTIAHTYSAHGILSEVQYDEGFNVTKVNSTTEFEAQIPTVGFAHTYIAHSGGNVETGITTNVFPSDLGIEWAISGFDYTEATGVSTIATRKTHNITTGEFVRLKDIEFTCSSEHSGVTTTIFPDTIIDEFEVLDVPSGTEIKINVGPSTIAHTYSANGVAQGVKFVGGYKVGNVIDSKNFSVNALPVGFAHTYVAHSGGVVETGFTTTRFPDNRGIPFAISNFEYDKTTGFSTITTKKNYSGLAIGDVINLSGIAMTCLAYGNEIAIYDFDYTASTGVSTILTADNHGLSDGDLVMLRDIEFSCAAPHAGVTTTIFPDGTQGFYFNVNAGSSGTSIVTNVGISTIAHDYVSGTGKVRIGITTSIFPDGTQGSEFKIFGLPAPNQIITNVGVSTIDHIYDDHGIVHGIKTVGPYEIETIKTDTEFEVDVFKVGFAHTFVPNRRKGATVAEAAKFNYLTFGSGYFNAATVVVEEDGHSGSAATIITTVGAGGSLSFTIEDGGTGYTDPTIQVSIPSYANLPIEGISRLGIGATTDTGKGVTVSLSVGPAGTTGIGTTTFAVKGFTLNNPGFAFLRGDLFRPVGLVTAVGVGTNYSEFTLEVLNVLNDTFSSWNFGQIDYIDSIRSLQDGQRTRFPLKLNGNSLSFQRDITDQQSVEIDLDAVLLIFVNGVVQVPKKDYFFEGGTSFNFNFTSPPRVEDDISLYFYRGTRGTDSALVTVYETVKPGDRVQMLRSISGDVQSQDTRTIFSIIDSTDIETNVYRQQGIDGDKFRPLNFTRQKKDVIISEQVQYKVRDSLEAQIMPVGKVIGNFGSSDTEIFLDDAKFFQYEEDADGSNFGEIVCDALIVDYNDPVAAAVTAGVSVAGTITSLTINDGGSGYPDGDVSIRIANPPKVDNAKYGIVGVGTTAIATASASGGILTSVTITNPGFGYTNTNLPLVIVATAAPVTETIIDAPIILGYSGIITGIGTTTGVGGHPLALKFQVDLSNSGQVSLFPTLLPGYPIVVKDTVTGTGVTSVDSSDSEIVGIGSTNVDNIYIIQEYFIEGTTGIITCNIKSDTDTIGIITTTGDDIGQFSWGKLSDFTRGVSPITLTVEGNTFDVGLTTYPSITRRGVGLRNTGNINKQVSS